VLFIAKFLWNPHSNTQTIQLRDNPKIERAKDLKAIIQNYSLGLDADEIVKLYKESTRVKFDFFKVSVEERDDNKIYSHNFTQFFRVNNDSDDDN
jgi:hypothetical protein